ncbi:MAG: leucine-rich repeat domain-containing protein [Bacteroidales bacterium]|nr:leucine-rich repeat domain-containing protein [Bacteroidales bacterium]
MRRIILLTILCMGTIAYGQRQEQLLYCPNDNGATYTSLEEALQSTETVYRLKLTKLPNRDSLPEELFRLTELRELAVKGCRLNIVNQDIAKLKHLRVLNLDRNKLVRLPNAIGELEELEMLIISRNMIEILPDSIAKLKKLHTIDAWDNPMYILPESIVKLQNTLKTIDLRQIPLTKWEYEAMEALLPNTEILFTNICECENRRDHN